MKVTAVICEYNPFHTGHLLQLGYIKKDGDAAVIAVMSGSFVQRGEPAIYDKYARAHAAVMMGADLVIELPYPYCCSAAEFFAKGAVSIVDSLGCVDSLCFGSENGNIEELRKVSDILCSLSFREELEKKRSHKAFAVFSYAKLRQSLYEELYGKGYPVTPNDILAVEYLNALSSLDSKIVPETYQRKPGYSAGQARKDIFEKNATDMLPDMAVKIFENCDKYRIENAARLILSFYRNAEPLSLARFESMTNGLDYRLVSAARASNSLDEFMTALSSKTHTDAKIRRAIIAGMVGTESESVRAKPCFTQVLAVGRHGRELLKTISKCGNIDVLTKPAHYKKLTGTARQQAELNIKADELALFMCDCIKNADYFIKKSPYITET